MIKSKEKKWGEGVWKADPWFDEIYRKNANRLFKVANYILRNRAVAEELVQDTFMVLLVHREKVERYEHPEAFLIDVLRKRIGSELQRAVYRMEEPLNAKHEAISAADGFEESFEEALPDWLNEQDRQFLILRVEQGLCLREVALQMGCTEHACQARMYRLREKFRKRQKILSDP